MKVLFVTSLYPPEWEEYFRERTKHPLYYSSNVHQQAIVRGLLECNIDFQLLCIPALPAFPVRYKKIFTPKSEITINGEYRGNMISYCNLMAYKATSVRHRTEKNIIRWVKANQDKKEKIVILIYNSCSACKRIKKKFPEVSIVSVVTDLVDNIMEAAIYNSPLKRIQATLVTRQVKSLYPYIDKFVLLSKLMEEKIPQAVGRSMVVEGIYAEDGQRAQVQKEGDVRVLLYTGGMDEYSGVRALVEAFKQTSNPDFRLKVFGIGGLVPFVKQESEKDKRIEYGGVLPHSEIVRLQAQATCLINPRKPNGDITKYSFPSKTMEYMASATPMIGYRLEGMPQEYYQHMYTPRDLSVEALCETIERVLTLPKEEMEAFGEKARRFILENKTAGQQVAKIIEFIK